MMPMRYITRFKPRQIAFIEGVCSEIDVDNQLLTVEGAEGTVIEHMEHHVHSQWRR